MGANKAMAMKDVVAIADKDLSARITTEKDTLRKMMQTHTVSSSENPMSIRAKRRDIARMMTDLHKRKNTAK
jgi:large subunit ribosomal protein L29